VQCLARDVGGTLCQIQIRVNRIAAAVQRRQLQLLPLDRL
jgi:hypothetical protein